MSEEDKRPWPDLPEWQGNNRSHIDNYEKTLRMIIDGPLANVEPINDSLASLVRAVQGHEVKPEE